MIQQRANLVGWKSYTQPEGQLYFVSRNRQARFVTEEYMYDNDVREEVEAFVDALEGALLLVDSQGRWRDMDVLIEIWPDSWAYYIVDHKTRCIIWLEPQDVSWMAEQVWGIETIAHLSKLWPFKNC